MIIVRDIEKSFGPARALGGVSFHIKEGEFTGLVGINGAGKTTLVRILAGLSKATKGTVSIAGYDVRKNANDIRRQIGVMSHNIFLYGDLSAEENLYFYAKMYNVKNEQEKISLLLEQVGLYKRRHDLVRNFSRGMQQRLSLARATLHGPKILLLDEPFAGLDVNAEKLLKDLLDSFRQQNLTIFMTTHDIDFACSQIERLLALKNGILALDSATSGMEKERILTLLTDEGAGRS